METQALLAKYDVPTPRYTSYPTAPHFSAAVDPAIHRAWLAALPTDGVLSLYLHVPFCAELCWFCGCHTTATRNRAVLEAYADTLSAEIELVAGHIGRRAKVAHIHWGGGTPTALPAERIAGLMALLGQCFDIQPDAEIAIEIDPRTATAKTIETLGRIGFNRASLGMQDFDPAVQKAVNRHQSFEQTARCAERLRAAGITDINLDLVYGLPHQTTEGVRATVAQALEIRPARVAVFGYAHVPWMKKHQALIPDDTLPGAMERFAQREAADAAILAAGYNAIGLDHFALPEDGMARAAAEGNLKRNFQGYTTDTAPILVGLGTSAISALPQGYTQNHPATPAWRGAIRAGLLPTARGVALTEDDRLRRDVIEDLMCHGGTDLRRITARHRCTPATLAAAFPALGSLAQDGLITWDGTTVALTEAGKPFVRNVAACFDARGTTARHSRVA